MVNDEMIKLKKLKCKRCGHEWKPRTEKVMVCPNQKCHSAYWNVEPKNREEKIGNETGKDF